MSFRWFTRRSFEVSCANRNNGVRDFGAAENRSSQFERVRATAALDVPNVFVSPSELPDAA